MQMPPMGNPPHHRLLPNTLPTGSMGSNSAAGGGGGQAPSAGMGLGNSSSNAIGSRAMAGSSVGVGAGGGGLPSLVPPKGGGGMIGSMPLAPHGMPGGGRPAAMNLFNMDSLGGPQGLVGAGGLGWGDSGGGDG